jgi:hypothetical protein
MDAVTHRIYAGAGCQSIVLWDEGKSAWPVLVGASQISRYLNDKHRRIKVWRLLWRTRNINGMYLEAAQPNTQPRLIIGENSSHVYINSRFFLAE